jgi:hypothetical protein
MVSCGQDYLPFEMRAALGIFSAEERARELDGESMQAPTADTDHTDTGPGHADEFSAEHRSVRAHTLREDR